MGLFATAAMLSAQNYDQQAYANKYDQYYKDEWQMKILTPEQLKLTAEAAPKKLFVKPKKARNILVYTRTDGFRHFEGIPAWNAMMIAMEKNFGGQWKVTITEDRDEFKAENLKKYDCVVLNNSTGMFFREFEPIRQKMTGEQRKADDEYAQKLHDNFIEYIEKGGGAMALHAGCDAQHNREYVNMMGGLFAGHPWGAGNAPVTVLVEDRGHILLKDLWPEDEFKIQDEIYTFVEGYDRDKQRIQLSLDFDRSPKDGNADPMKETRRKDKDFGLSWVKSYGKGRIFYGAFGHRLDVFWRNPKINEYYMRGIQFACGDIDNVPTTPLGKDQMYKAEAAAAVNGILSMRDFDFGTEKDEKRGAVDAVFFRAYQAITSSAETAAAVEALCVRELKEKQGTLRYRMLLTDLLQVTGAQTYAADIAEIIERDTAADKKNRYYTESLFISLARSKDAKTTAILQKLATSAKTDFNRRNAVTALSYQNPKGALKFFGDIFVKANGTDDGMAWAAVSAMPRSFEASALDGIIGCYKSAKSPRVKTQAAELALSHTALNPASALKFASEIYADQKIGDALRTLAAIELMKQGKDIKLDVITESVIGVIGNFPQTKIPAAYELEKLPEHLRAEMIYALVKRNEGFDRIMKLKPESGGTVKAMAHAVAMMGTVADAVKVAQFADLLEDDRDLRSAAFSLASVKAKGKLLALTEAYMKLPDGGKSRRLLMEATGNMDASSAVDALFAIINSGAADADKKAALRTLENAAAKNSDVFVKAAEVYAKGGALKQDVMRLMVVGSRRDCDDAMTAAAGKILAANKDATMLRFAEANMGDAGVKMALDAFKLGLKKEALETLSKWNNSTALMPLVELAKSVQGAERKAVQAAIISALMKSGDTESPAVEYMMTNAVDPKDAKTVAKLKRLNLGNAPMIKLPGGIEGTSSHKPNDLKNAFDGNMGSRWSSGESRAPGMWIQFTLPKPRFIQAIVLDLHTSKGDGIVSPIVYAGFGMEDFDEVKITHSKNDNGADVLTFATPKKVDMIRIENGGTQGGWWSIHEISLVDDPATFKDMKQVGKGFSANASHNVRNIGQAFDGNINTRWDTSEKREPGMWFMFGMPKSQKISEVHLITASSGGDRVMNPKVFVGDKIETMKPVKVKYEKAKDRDILKLEDKPTGKFIRVENTKESGGYWSIHEVEIK